MKMQKMNAQYINELEQVLSLDPRPAYQHDDERIYGLSFGEFNIKFTCNEDSVFIQMIE